MVRKWMGNTGARRGDPEFPALWFLVCQRLYTVWEISQTFFVESMR